MQEKGSISIHTENIFPIIKKFLYSDHEIFLRELVSNAVDATQKLKQLASLGEFKGELGDLTIDVSFDEKEKTITITDRGIGMTAEEIKKYINQIAFSGAAEFLEKYKDKGEQHQIIGNFGLGFYSAFMVAKKVELITLSHQDGAQAARWTCEGDTEFEITPAEKTERGTTIILHVAEDSEEFLKKARLQEILMKYSRFLPVPIRLGQRDEQVEEGVDDKGLPKYKTEKVDNIINDTNPIWTKAPSELKDEDYKDFYRDLYPFSPEPLFWIHLNVDYPFNLTGVLYFPQLKNDFEVQRNKIQLYSRQVFITDEVKDVVPDFLQLLHGVIDSPDIPLNVSRSYLQSDSNVKKINGYISKKVADKLGELFKNERESYEKKWDDIGLFVKFGIISDEKFAEKAKEFALLKNLDGKYFTIEEYKKHVEANQVDKNKNHVFIYTHDAELHHSYIEAARKRGYDVLNLNSPIDSHFLSTLERQFSNVMLKRVDADVIGKLVDKEEKPESILTEDETKKLKEVFEKSINDKNHQVMIEPMATDDLPVVITLPEFIRRMKDMQKTGGGSMMFGDLPMNLTVTVNANHALIRKTLDETNAEKQAEIARQLYDLGLLSQGMLTGENLTRFVERSLALGL
jgi:molecular chaperone HtpG